MIISIEGTDGCGKETQSKLITEYIDTKTKHRVVRMHYPRYQASEFGREVAAYLQGEYGSISETHPKLISLLYANDRLQSLPEIKRQLDSGRIIIMDRYVESNLIHQSIKVPMEEREALISWIEWLEYDLYKLPKPDLTIFLNVPPEYTDKIIKARNSNVVDIHEESISHIMDAYVNATELAKRNNWVTIDCVKGQTLLSIEDINERIQKVITNIL